MTNFPAHLNLAMPIEWDAFTASILKFLSLEFLSDIPGAQCIDSSLNFYDRLMMMTIVPGALIVAFALGFNVSKRLIKHYGTESNLIPGLLR